MVAMAPHRSSRSHLLLVLGALLGGCLIIGDDGDAGDDGTTSSATAGDLTGGATGGDCFSPPSCDPLAPSCADTDKCIPNDGGFTCVAVPPGTVEAGLGDPCSGALSCGAGLVCSAGTIPDCVGGEGCCVAVCDLGAPQCPTGQTCSPYASPGSSLCYEDVGLCVVGG